MYHHNNASLQECHIAMQECMIFQISYGECKSARLFRAQEEEEKRPKISIPITLPGK